MLGGIPDASMEKFSKVYDSNCIKILGLFCKSADDVFRIQINSISIDSLVEKRQVISEIERIFDSIRLVVPIIVVGKQLMQSLWKSKVHRDQVLLQW